MARTANTRRRPRRSPSRCHCLDGLARRNSRRGVSSTPCPVLSRPPIVEYFVNDLELEDLGSLRTVCRKLRVPAMGQKADLQERVQEALLELEGGANTVDGGGRVN